jgi:hypothetical protein
MQVQIIYIFCVQSDITQKFNLKLLSYIGKFLGLKFSQKL